MSESVLNIAFALPSDSMVKASLREFERLHVRFSSRAQNFPELAKSFSSKQNNIITKMFA